MRWVLAACLVVLLGGAVGAQRFLREGPGQPIRRPPQQSVFSDGRLAFCKLMYNSVRREPMGIGWWTDYPFAGIHLLIRTSELTRTPISRDGTEPNHWVVSLTDDALFQCPFLMASDVGTIGLSVLEADRLRDYLLKGGFLWVDDFWGEAAWAQWTSQLARVLPPSDYPIVELPLGHPVFHTLYNVREMPQITNINNWRRTGDVIEQSEQNRGAHLRAILDRHGRVMVAMTFNTDMGDSWEREEEDPEFFKRFSVEGYELGVDMVLYALTH